MARTRIRAAAIIIRDGKILLMHRIKRKREYFVIPGGGVETGETWEETLIREVKEETSMDVVDYKLLFMANAAPGRKKDPYFVCSVSGEAVLGGEEREFNSVENFYELIWVPLSKLSSTNLLPRNIKMILMKHYRV